MNNIKTKTILISINPIIKIIDNMVLDTKNKNKKILISEDWIFRKMANWNC